MEKMKKILSIFITLCLCICMVPLNIKTEASGNIVVVLDPGHGGTQPGASSNGLYEKNLVLKIAQYCKSELEQYAGITVYMTRNSDTTLGLTQRAEIAEAYGADVLISLHLNAGGGGTANGSEVYVTQNTYKQTYNAGSTQLANSILGQLSSLGLANRGALTKCCTNGDTYDFDGSLMDYYTVINASVSRGFPGMIVEHCFMDNANDFNNFLTSDEGLKSLGIADATGIANYYGLNKKSMSSNGDNLGVIGNTSQTLEYSSYAQNTGWLSTVKNGLVSGTTGSAKQLEAIKISLDGLTGISYRTQMQSYGWQDWVSDGSVAGIAGSNKRLEAIQIKLSDELSSQYDVYYRVHSQTYGWLGWAKNGETAGTIGYSKRVEAIQIILLEKGSSAPGSVENSCYYEVTNMKSGNLSFQAYIQNHGWKSGVNNSAGNNGNNIESIKLAVNDLTCTGTVRYRGYFQSSGWKDYVSDGVEATKAGTGKRMEAFQAELTGDLAEKYDLYYRTYVTGYGWLDWACNGQTAGSTGLARQIEKIQIILVEKESFDVSTDVSCRTSLFDTSLMNMSAYIQDKGWSKTFVNGSIIGTMGESRRIEAYNLSMGNTGIEGNLMYLGYFQTYGYSDWATSGTIVGNVNQHKRLEAIKIMLTGELADTYDVYYRAHCQSYGWLGWTKNGEVSGTTGLSKRVEAMQIMILEKGTAPEGIIGSAYKY